MGRVLARALGALVVPAMAVASVPGRADPGNPFAQRLLAAHNAERERAGLPRLSWSSDLARDAQEWAQHLAQQGTLRHADGNRRRNMGENLWMGSAGYYSAEDMIGGFIAERARFRAGTFPQVSASGNWADVGHYTQVIWPRTTEVGCAVAKGAVNDFLVCRYNPPGNMFGEKVG